MVELNRSAKFLHIYLKGSLQIMLCESLTTLNNWLLWQICVRLNFLRWINVICVTFIDFHSIIRIFELLWHELREQSQPSLQSKHHSHFTLDCFARFQIASLLSTTLPPPLPIHTQLLIYLCFCWKQQKW